MMYVPSNNVWGLTKEFYFNYSIMDVYKRVELMCNAVFK